MTASLTLDQARRLAVRATGLDRPRPTTIDRRHFRRVLGDVDVVQIDSVNVVARAHELLFHARLGPHDTTRLDDWLWRSREAHECWAHVASLMPADAWPLLAHRREDNVTHPWAGVQAVVDDHPGFVERVLEEIVADGPLTVSDLADPGQRSGGYWGWGPGKNVLHWLFVSGQVAVHHRDRSFRAAYDLSERVIPAVQLEAPSLPRDVATAELAMRAVRAQGVGTTASIADHHRQPVRAVATQLARLETAGRVRRVGIHGLKDAAWMLPDTVIPRVVRGRALVAPFDPLVWFRRRTERLFDMRYRIEIYVPEAKREYGYYVMPFLLGHDLVARVDCKADRASGVLQVRGAWAQPGVEHDLVARELATELRSLARHTVGGPDLALVRNGDLAAELSRHV
ncbi:MAG TPA: crosslink repair DNA glycosylase YcaQ family protein [Nitriliruptoraceae bacterium]|nr:crosslink repair DNA glycosylase YcaQ family protein [Nitriliruptoraceae bacterium]